MIRDKIETEKYTLYLGDCRDVLLNLATIDLLCTDPPYGIFACGGKWGRKEELQWDKEPASFVSDLLRYGRQAIIWGGNYFNLPPSRGWLVWYKRDAVPSAASVELAWTSFDMNARLVDQTIAATNAERCGHPTQKPLRVMSWSLSFAPMAETVLDPFMGSGTTGVACMKLGRKFIGIEIDEAYFKIAHKRIAQAAEEPPLFKAAREAEQAELALCP